MTLTIGSGDFEVKPVDYQTINYMLKHSGGFPMAPTTPLGRAAVELAGMRNRKVCGYD